MQGTVCACNNDHLVCGVEVCVVGIYRGECFVKVYEAKAEEECAAGERNCAYGSQQCVVLRQGATHHA